MGKITDMKFKEADFDGKLVAELPDDPIEAGLGPDELKAYFDALPKVLIAIQKLNPFFDFLESAEAARGLGALLTDGTEGNIQAALGELKTISDGKDVNLAELAGSGRTAETVMGAYQKVLDHAAELLTQAGAGGVGMEKLYTDDASGNTVRDKLIKLAQMVVEIDKFTPRGIANSHADLPLGGNAYGDFFYIRTADVQVFEEWVWTSPPQWQYYGNVSLYILSGKADKDLGNITNFAVKTKVEYAGVSADKIVFSPTETGLSATNVQDAITEVNNTLTTALSTITANGLTPRDVVTATCGQTIMTATCPQGKDRVTFLNVFRGTWVVATGSKTATVDISAVGDFAVFGGGEQDQLINYTALYWQGDLCGDVAGGWGKYNSVVDSIMQYLPNRLSVTMPTGTVAIEATTKTIDMTPYSKAGIVWDNSAASTYGAFFALSTNRAARPLESGATKIITDKTAFGKKISEVDVSGVNSPQYILTGAEKAMAEPTRTLNIYAMYLLKSDDYQTLCARAGVTAPANLAVLIADTAKLTTIFANADAIAYMVARCTGDFMVGVLNDTAAKAALKTSPYLNKIIANPHWARFMMILAPDLLNYTALYDHGDENVAVTGGWRNNSSSTSNTTITKSDKIKIRVSSGTQNGTAGVISANKINFTGYAKLAIVVPYFKSTGLNGFGLITSLQNITSANLGEIARTNPLTNSDDSGILHVDIASIASQYLFVGIWSAAIIPTFDMDIAGMFMLKPDNYQPWLTAAGLNPSSYATLEAVLADASAVTTLMANRGAIDYMLGCTGDLMFAVCNSAVAMAALTNSAIAWDAAFAHPVWYKFMTMCPISLVAMDSAPDKAQVPVMVADNMPSGLCISSQVYTTGSYQAYRAFDRDTTTKCALYADKAVRYLGYKFTTAVNIYRLSITNVNADLNRIPKDIVLQGSDGGVDWDNVATYTHSNIAGLTAGYIVPMAKAYLYWRCLCNSNYGSATDIDFAEVQFHGKKVPQ